MSDILKDYAARLQFVGDNAAHWSRYRHMTEAQLRDRAATAAAYWLDASPHEHTYLDAMVCTLYARLAIQAIATQRRLIHKLCQLLVDADATATWRGDRDGLCDAIDNDGKPYMSQAAEEMIDLATELLQSQEADAS